MATVVLRGLSRQVRFAGVPVPYFWAGMSMAFIVFAITKKILVLVAVGLVCYAIAFTVGAINPNLHVPVWKKFATTWETWNAFGRSAYRASTYRRLK